MLFDNVTIRLLGSDDFPAEAKQRAASDLTAAADAGALTVRTEDPLPLDHIAAAHDRIDAGTRTRILLDVSLWAGREATVRCPGPGGASPRGKSTASAGQCRLGSG